MATFLVLYDMEKKFSGCILYSHSHGIELWIVVLNEEYWIAKPICERHFVLDYIVFVYISIMLSLVPISFFSEFFPPFLWCNSLLLFLPMESLHSTNRHSRVYTILCQTVCILVRI